MKKHALYQLGIAIMSVYSFFAVSWLSFASSYFDILTDNDQEVVVTNDITGDPLRQGASNPNNGINGLYNNGTITTFLQAQNDTIAFIQNILNWALWLVGLVALIYLLYNGFLMVTAAGDDGQFKKWAKAARTAVIALIGLGVSALVVNLILYLIAQIL